LAIPSTSAKSYDFTVNEEQVTVPKMQITSKKVIPTAFSDLENALSSGDINLVAPRETEAVITLELPNEIAMRSDFDWSMEEVNLLESLLGSMNSNKTIDTTNTDKTGSMISGIAHRIGANVATTFGGALIYKNAGYALAPLKEIFFKGNGPRNFNWTWDLYPRNAQESDAIMELCDRVREQSHAVMQDLGVYQIPNEWEIEWLNCNLPKITTCACITADANYTAAGAPRFLENGNPAFVRLNLAFQEITINTRNTLENMRYK
jgi:hypothetical protein